MSCKRYLICERGPAGGTVRALLNADRVVIIDTLWPEKFMPYTARPDPGGDDRHAQEREMLDLAEVVRIDPAFTLQSTIGSAPAPGATRDAGAMGTARCRAGSDLGGAPQLIARWEGAKPAACNAWAADDRGVGCGPARGHTP
jgi:hypothetical protein